MDMLVSGVSVIRIKQIMFILFIITGVFLLTSCSLKNIYSERAEANKILIEILNALENEDEVAMKSLLAPDMLKKNRNIEDEIQKAFNYFNGNIISYKDVGTPASSISVRDGKTVYLGIGNARSGSVITDCNEYIISFSAILINENNPKQEGVWRIWIGKNSDDYMILGDSDMPTE